MQRLGPLRRIWTRLGKQLVFLHQTLPPESLAPITYPVAFPRFSPKILIWADKIRTKDCTGQWPLFSKLTSISPLPAIG
jgi:hypothetical protein